MKMMKNAFQNLQNLHTRMIERRICRSKLAANQGAKVCFVTWDVHPSKIHGGSQLLQMGLAAHRHIFRHSNGFGTSWGRLGDVKLGKYIIHMMTQCVCVIKHMAK
jgi:hypothetical protein